MVLINLTMFQWIVTKGFGETALTKFSHNSAKNHWNWTGLVQCTTMYCTYQSYKSKIHLKSYQGFRRNRTDKIFKGNISKSHSSAKNHRTGMGLGQCTTRHFTYQSYEVSLKSEQGFWRNHRQNFKCKYFKVT